jgi:hypothetical protein
VGFYWWLGDPLTKERIAWQLDQLKDKGIAGLQVNYAHSDQGGQTWGLTYPSDPPLFSEPWWELFGWFLKEARKRGMSVSLSDYTLGPGQGWYFDEILRENPGMRGASLDKSIRACPGGQPCSLELPQPPVSVSGYRLQNGTIVPGSGIDLRARVAGSTVQWTPPDGEWQVVGVYAVVKPFSLDPMHPRSGPKVVEKFFQRFEDRNPGESGKGLNFFFSDELDFGVRGWLWNGALAAEFRKRKGYDIVPELAGLFVDIGPRTPKLRLDYSDVMVSLEEEGFFRPLYEWHRSRGMLFGCDHGGRGRDVTEFGDYFRTQRWMTGPGNDQPRLAADIIKNKVASSIAHLYERPRTWLEGFYGSGWGTTTPALTEATLRNFAMGHNLLTLHGLYYATRGGWWEWAPPCNHFRMPYWTHMGEFLRMTEHLSYLLSQGVHRTDVAIVYPVAPVEAGMGGKESVDAAFGLGMHLYRQGIDFDFIDFESLARARIRNRQLLVSGEEYRVLILPAMRAARHSTIRKALEFQRAGGIVMALGALPEASDRAGRDDPELLAMVREAFRSPASRAATPEQIAETIGRAFPRDFNCLDTGGEQPNVLHRRIGPRDVYMVYGADKGSECGFRAGGKVELWNPWTGGTAPLPVVSQSRAGTRIRMPLGEDEAQLIVFSPGKPELLSRAIPEEPVRSIAVDGPWEFELKPTLDNRFGDFRLPASDGPIAAEAWRFRYADEVALDPGWLSPAFDDSNWKTVTHSYGPRFWKLGPLPENADLAALEAELVRARQIDPANKSWQPYEFSMRWGVENDPGHQGYHGLKGEVSDDFIALGAPKIKPTTIEYEREAGGSRYYLWTSVSSPAAGEARAVAGGMTPVKAWLNGAPIEVPGPVRLRAGANPLLLRYDGPGRGHVVLIAADAPRDWMQAYPLAMTWFNRPGLLPFDTRPQAPQPAGWYRFTSPPGLRAMTIIAQGTVRAWAGGRELAIGPARPRDDGSHEYKGTVSAVVPEPVLVAIRVEQERGSYGGAALPEPLSLDCGPGLITAGDWSKIDGLSSYSGGAWYRKTVALSEKDARGEVWLNLGDVVSTAEVHVNGKPAGIKVAPPWKVDVSKLVRPGHNRVEILVYNTLANHYQTIPTRYRGSAVSGLLGPVSLEVK